MIVDSSAILAILSEEPEADRLHQAIGDAPTGARMSVANALEVTLVIEGRGGPVAGIDAEHYLRKMQIELVPVTLRHLVAARYAWRQFGKGNHPAALNFGDCFAYALADVSGEPLLFKGNDFTQTDIKAA